MFNSLTGQATTWHFQIYSRKKKKKKKKKVFHNNFSSPLNKLPLATQQEQNVHPISIDNQYKKDL